MHLIYEKKNESKQFIDSVPYNQVRHMVRKIRYIVDILYFFFFGGTINILFISKFIIFFTCLFQTLLILKIKMLFMTSTTINCEHCKMYVALTLFEDLADVPIKKRIVSKFLC